MASVDFRNIIVNWDLDKPLEFVQKLYHKKKYEHSSGKYGFEIDLDSPRHSFNAGDIISGNVFFAVNHSTFVKGIKIKLIGEANTYWGGKAVGKCRNFMALPAEDNEHIIYRIQNVFGYDASEKLPLRIPPGRHHYPFYFRLPKSLPSTYSHKLGHVKYLLEASLQGSHQFSLLKLSKCIEVSIQAIVDLRLFPNVDKVVRLKKEHSVGLAYCLCRGIVGFHLILTKSGYTPGEKIPFTFNLFNSSGMTVSSVSLSLVQITHFVVGDSCQETRKTIRQMDGPTLAPNSKEVWQRDNLRMHCVPPTGLGNCKIIKVAYLLKVKMKVDYNLTLKGEVPLVIGTVSLQSRTKDDQEKRQSWAEIIRQPKSILKKRPISM